MCRAMIVWGDKKRAMTMLVAAYEKGNKDGFFVGAYKKGEYLAIRTLEIWDAIEFIAENEAERWDLHARAATHGGVLEKWVHGWEGEANGIVWRLWHNGIGAAIHENDSYDAFQTILKHMNEGMKPWEAMVEASKKLYMSGVYMMGNTEEDEVYVYAVDKIVHIRAGKTTIAVSSVDDVFQKKIELKIAVPKKTWGEVTLWTRETIKMEAEEPLPYKGELGYGVWKLSKNGAKFMEDVPEDRIVPKYEKTPKYSYYGGGYKWM